MGDYYYALICETKDGLIQQILHYNHGPNEPEDTLIPVPPSMRSRNPINSCGQGSFITIKELKERTNIIYWGLKKTSKIYGEMVSEWKRKKKENEKKKEEEEKKEVEFMQEPEDSNGGVNAFHANRRPQEEVTILSLDD